MYIIVSVLSISYYVLVMNLMFGKYVWTQFNVFGVQYFPYYENTDIREIKLQYHVNNTLYSSTE